MVAVAKHWRTANDWRVNGNSLEIIHSFVYVKFIFYNFFYITIQLFVRLCFHLLNQSSMCLTYFVLQKSLAKKESINEVFFIQQWNKSRSKATIKTLKKDQTRRTQLMHPSSSGLFVTWAYLLQTTLPVCVTKPNSDTFTYKTVPKITKKNTFCHNTQSCVCVRLRVLLYW